MLSACTAVVTPTLMPPADTPVVANLVTRVAQASAEAAEQDGPKSTPAVSALEQPNEEPTPTVTTALTRWPTPPPGQVGLRPEDAHLFRQPSIGPQTTLEWRPPPMPVPLSINPHDHYWLMRPIPSGKRNYDLEYYPYGNDVLIPELGPYRIHRGLDFPNTPGTPVPSPVAWMASTITATRLSLSTTGNGRASTFTRFTPTPWSCL